MGTGDSYKRIEVAPGRYQCGCEWKKLDWVGEFLSECAIHSAATASSVRKFDRERAGEGWLAAHDAPRPAPEGRQ